MKTAVNRVGQIRIIILFACCIIAAFMQHPLGATAAPGDIITVAGGGNGDGGPATNAFISGTKVFADSSGNVYIADNEHHRIRKVSPSGVITTVAGTGVAGYSGDGGQATAALLNYPMGVALDGSGNMYIADTNNNCIRKVDHEGVISTVAGSVSGGFSGDGGPAALALLSRPADVAVDAYGNIYIADRANYRIRKIDMAGTITTIAGNGLWGFSGDGGQARSARMTFPSGISVDAAGNIYIADEGNHRIRKVSTVGVISTIAGNGVAGYWGDGVSAISAVLNNPRGVFTDSSGNHYIADSNNNRIRRVDANGTITTIAGNGAWAFSGDGGSAIEAGIQQPWGATADSNGNIYIADTANNRIRQVSISGMISTFAGNGTMGYCGDGGPAVSAALSQPNGIARDSLGNSYIADSINHRIRKVDVNGVITTIAGSGMQGYDGDGMTAVSASLNMPQGVALDAAGNLHIADMMNHRIRKVDVNGVIATIAGSGMQGYDGDGMTAVSASLNMPQGVALDAAGNLHIADMMNHRIRKVDVNGVITTIAGSGMQGYDGDGITAVSASLNMPQGVALDASGNLYIADSMNHRIRKVDVNGVITTIAGSGMQGYDGDGMTAVSASLNTPQGVALDASGNLYIADSMNHRIRKVDVNGVITTFVGTGVIGYGGDNGPAIEAMLNRPSHVCADVTGSIYFSDSENNRIRMVIAAIPLSGTISINSGKAYTNSTSISLTLSCTSAEGVCEQMQFSDDNVIWSNPPDAYAVYKQWIVSNGDGIKTVYVKYKDSTGNWSESYQDSIVLDTTAPIVSITSPIAGETNNNRPMLTYTVSDGTVVVKMDGNAVSKTSGATLDPLTDGTHRVRVESTDTAGNFGFSEVSFTIDTIAPIVNLTSPASSITKNNTPVLTYTVDGGAVVVSVDGAIVPKVSGNALDALADGTHVVRVESTDTAGNIGFAQVLFTVDTVAPTVSINAVSSPTNLSAQTISGTREGNAIIAVSVDTAALVGPVIYPTATTWSCVISGLMAGGNTITVIVADTASNSATEVASITLDTTAPIVNITSPVSGLTNNATQLLLYTASDGSVVVKLDGAIVNKISGDKFDSLADGPHTVHVEAADAAGNTGSASVTFTIDTVAPAITMDEVISPTPKKSQKVTGSRDSGSLVTVKASTFATIGSVLYPSATTWSCTISKMVNGVNIITATARDAVGNSASVSKSITIR